MKDICPLGDFLAVDSIRQKLCRERSFTRTQAELILLSVRGCDNFTAHESQVCLSTEVRISVRIRDNVCGCV